MRTCGGVQTFFAVPFICDQHFLALYTGAFSKGVPDLVVSLMQGYVARYH